MRGMTLLLLGILGLSSCQLAQPSSEWQGPIFPDVEETKAREPEVKSQPSVTVETILGPEEKIEPIMEEEIATQPVYGSFDERIARNVRVNNLMNMALLMNTKMFALMK